MKNRTHFNSQLKLNLIVAKEIYNESMKHMFDYYGDAFVVGEKFVWFCISHDNGTSDFRILREANISKIYKNFKFVRYDIHPQNPLQGTSTPSFNLIDVDFVPEKANKNTREVCIAEYDI